MFQVVLQHFYRAGQLEIGETLAQEAGLTADDADGKKAGKEPFMEMNRILEALKDKDLRKWFKEEGSISVRQMPCNARAWDSS